MALFEGIKKHISRSRHIAFELYAFRWHLLALFLLAFYFGADQSIVSYVLKMMLDAMEHARETGRWIWVGAVMGLYLVTGIVVACLFRVYEWLMLQFKPDLERALINKLVSYSTYHSHAFYQEHKAGELAAQCDTIAEQVPELLDVLLQVVSRIATVGVAVLSTLFLDPWAASVMGVWFWGFIAIACIVATRSHLYAEKAYGKRMHISGDLTDLMSNMSTVRLFARRGYEYERLRAVCAEWVDAVNRRDWFLLRWNVVLCIWWVLRDGALLYVLADLFSTGRISLGDVAFALSLSVQCTVMLWGITYDFSKIIKLYGAITQGLDALCIPRALSAEATEKACLDLFSAERGLISFEDVSFAYRPGLPIFRALSLRIRSGEKVGLVGYSGAGKSTFVHLLLRLYDVQEGVIRIGGQDIRGVKQDSLRNHISFIPQDPGLFHRTVMENIRYGNIAASDEEVIAAARLARADEFISNMPHGYDTLVGDRGTVLSGGQRQRVAIARAFLKRAPILVLDEATSALDALTEAYIQESIALLSQKATTIVIAHRLATLLTMDRIIVFDHGKVVEDGSHQELLSRNALYANMWRAQSHGMLPMQ